MSVGDGEWGKGRPVAQMAELGWLGPDIGYVHCTNLADDELSMIADSGGTAVVSPDIEAQMWGHPAINRLLDAGLLPSISVDCVTSIAGDMFGVMRTALCVQRALDHLEADRRGDVLDELRLSARSVLELATIGGARFCGLEDRIGTLTPGKQADVVVIDTERPPPGTGQQPGRHGRPRRRTRRRRHGARRRGAREAAWRRSSGSTSLVFARLPRRRATTCSARPTSRSTRTGFRRAISRHTRHDADIPPHSRASDDHECNPWRVR